MLCQKRSEEVLKQNGLITLLVNHINSTKKPGLNNLSPYEMIPDDDEDMRKLMKLLDLKPITAKEVNLTKELLNKYFFGK